MPRKSSVTAQKSAESLHSSHRLTSGDIARLLHVDLKTIHNWVRLGHIAGRRTEGRHLRFERTGLVSFMRKFGYPVPTGIAEQPASIVYCSDGAKPGLPRGLTRTHTVASANGLYECALVMAAGDQEVLILELDRLEQKQARLFVHTLRAWPRTRGVSIVGVAAAAAARRGFLSTGGNIALSESDRGDLSALVTWLVGATEDRPAAAELA